MVREVCSCYVFLKEYKLHWELTSATLQKLSKLYSTWWVGMKDSLGDISSCSLTSIICCNCPYLPRTVPEFCSRLLGKYSSCFCFWRKLGLNVYVVCLVAVFLPPLYLRWPIWTLVCMGIYACTLMLRQYGSMQPAISLCTTARAILTYGELVEGQQTEDSDQINFHYFVRGGRSSWWEILTILIFVGRESYFASIERSNTFLAWLKVEEEMKWTGRWSLVAWTRNLAKNIYCWPRSHLKFSN